MKDDIANAGKEDNEMFEELKLQGLSDEQAREVLRELAASQAIVAEDGDSGEDIEDLLGSVRNWMKEQPEGPIPEDAIRDFNMKVRFQGHVETTPPDHLAAMLNVLLGQALSSCDLAAAMIKPGAIAKAFAPLLERWAIMLQGLYSKVPDVLEAVGVVVQTINACVIQTGAPENAQDSAMVGCLMAVRELDDLVEDEDLLVGCKAVEPRSRVLEKFIEFLEEALEEDDEDGEGDDE